LHLEDKVNTPDVASDLQGYNDPLQDAGNTVFRSSKPQNNTLTRRKYPIDELIGMFFLKSSDPVSSHLTTG
jgi:hypothetical protein